MVDVDDRVVVVGESGVGVHRVSRSDYMEAVSGEPTESGVSTEAGAY